jgi:septal ring factor EnvC (AmiA/AmiB activator)
MDTQVEEGCVESSNSYLIDEEEALLKLKDKILDVLEAKDDQYTFDPDFNLDEYIKESLEKYQRHAMALRKILMKQEKYIKRLKTDIISQAEEKNKVDDEIRKILKFNVHLKTQIKEARRREEKSKRFMNNSTILDEILNCQRSPNDKFGLGYNKEVAHFEVITSKKYEVIP